MEIYIEDEEDPK